MEIKNDFAKYPSVLKKILHQNIIPTLLLAAIFYQNCQTTLVLLKKLKGMKWYSMVLFETITGPVPAGSLPGF